MSEVPLRQAAKGMSGAARMRCYRERRRAGVIRVVFYLQGSGINVLAGLGWLAPDHARDPVAVNVAFEDFVNKAATLGIRPDDVR